MSQKSMKIPSRPAVALCCEPKALTGLLSVKLSHTCDECMHTFQMILWYMF
ncbi:Uncharacterized protein DAT39_015371 [Clarias magur]|uniref:Uncharacterized protein n=1 Tax=Clarias magur TaxID=1594786 RepID=A0A8J4UI34_CLAMG|nr:Uncharacterized protein DAT39_015371 [Clarias magur]